jgi:hypothetical protein
MGIELCADDELGYLRSRTPFAAGDRLILDEPYRLAHLPLVAPDHPGVIASREGTHYDRGHHPAVFSLVMPVSWQSLSASPAFQELEKNLKTSAFASKICWPLMERRKDRLHATVSGSLAVGGNEPPAFTPAQQRELAALGPIAVELRGLFSGNVNKGRLYLRVYPERRNGKNLFREMQRILGRMQTDLYLVGLYNLIDDLDLAETAALAALIEKWWDRPILRFDVPLLWLLWATDDLVLNGGVCGEVALCG